MKKFLRLIIIMILLIPVVIFAQGSVSVSTGSLNINKGESASFTITANNAAGKITISSSNPSVASVSMSETFLDMQSATVSVNALSVGSVVITVFNADVTTYDDEDISGQTKTISVNIVDNVSPEPTPEPTPQPSPSINPTPIPSTEPNISVIQEPKSNNALLSDLKIEGYNISFDKNILEYKIDVDGDVDKLKVKAIAEDEKASIIILGNESIKSGENFVSVVVTAEDGSIKEYVIKVNKAKSNNNNIKKLSIKNYKINFNHKITDYIIQINKENDLSIDVELENSSAKYVILGNENLKDKSIITIEVTAENGDIKKYNIKVSKKKGNTLLLIISLCFNGIFILCILLFCIKYFLKKKKDNSFIN